MMSSGNKMLLKVVALLFSIVVVAGTMSACETKDTTGPIVHYSSVVLVIGNHENSPQVILDKDRIADLTKIVKSDKIDEISVINATSIPSVEDKGKLNVDFNESDTTVLNKNITNAINNCIKKVAEITPKSEGADYIEAIRVAAKQSNGESPLILVFGSGLNDSGMLNFSSGNLLYQTPDFVIEQLKSEAFMKEQPLSNVEVRWYNIGQTNTPQMPLNQDQIDNEQAIYKAVLDKMGAKKVVIDSKRLANDKVKAVEINGMHVDQSPLKADSFDWKTQTLTFDESQLGNFLPNLDQLEHEGIARDALSGLVTLLKDNSKVNITITGHIAKVGGKTVSHDELALNRAIRIKELLSQMGIDSNRISCDDKGSSEATGDEVPSDRKVTIRFKEIG
jgi:outer membrane protein OmpA-like peptidoglycan-associated protein